MADSIRIKNLPFLDAFSDGTYLPVETDLGDQTRKATGAQILAYIEANLNMSGVKSMRTTEALTSGVPKDIELTDGMSSRYCTVTVKDPENNYEPILMSYSSPDDETIRLDVGTIADGDYLILILEVP